VKWEAGKGVSSCWMKLSPQSHVLECVMVDLWSGRTGDWAPGFALARQCSTLFFS
jgi:hypothetical protein